MSTYQQLLHLSLYGLDVTEDLAALERAEIAAFEALPLAAHVAFDAITAWGIYEHQRVQAARDSARNEDPRTPLARLMTALWVRDRLTYHQQRWLREMQQEIQSNVNAAALCEQMRVDVQAERLIAVARNAALDAIHTTLRGNPFLALHDAGLPVPAGYPTEAALWVADFCEA